MTGPEDAIRARRRLTNKLIAGREAARLRPFLAADVKLIAGDGSLMVGVDSVLEAFAAQFADPAFVAYERIPAAIALDGGETRAAEHGGWTGLWSNAPPMRGDYLAVWRKVTGQWVIESELYVTLS
jgi:hypothetical protein